MEEKLIYNPLVSIILITYNSAKYVLETLESAKAQTYKNIELIVSDDGSKDDTIDICKHWIEKNKTEFVRALLITTQHNTGVSANCNRGLKVAQGEWLKFIAGDDALTANCIRDFMRFVAEKPNIYIVSANMYLYKNSLEKEFYMKMADRSEIPFNEKNITAAQQYNFLLRGTQVGAPSLIFKNILFKNIGGFDEDMPYEDWPFLLKCTKFGYKIEFLNRCVVKYRIHTESMYNHAIENRVINDFFKANRTVYNKYVKRELKKTERFVDSIYYRLILYFYESPKFNNKKNMVGKLFLVNLQMVYKIYKKLLFPG